MPKRKTYTSPHITTKKVERSFNKLDRKEWQNGEGGTKPKTYATRKAVATQNRKTMESWTNEAKRYYKQFPEKGHKYHEDETRQRGERVYTKQKHDVNKNYKASPTTTRKKVTKK